MVQVKVASQPRWRLKKLLLLSLFIIINLFIIIIIIIIIITRRSGIHLLYGSILVLFVAGWRHALRSEWPFIIIISSNM